MSAPGSSASVFDPAGKLRRVPAFEEGKSPNPQSSQLAAITYGEDLDVDAQGTVYVADRGANAIKIWDTKGNERVVKINGPVAVAALPDGEFAVANSPSGSAPTATVRTSDTLISLACPRS